jgi:hypothetical protein
MQTPQLTDAVGKVGGFVMTLENATLSSVMNVEVGVGNFINFFWPGGLFERLSRVHIRNLPVHYFCKLFIGLFCGSDFYGNISRSNFFRFTFLIYALC